MLIYIHIHVIFFVFMPFYIHFHVIFFIFMYLYSHSCYIFHIHVFICTFMLYFHIHMLCMVLFIHIHGLFSRHERIWMHHFSHSYSGHQKVFYVLAIPDNAFWFRSLVWTSLAFISNFQMTSCPRSREL